LQYLGFWNSEAQLQGLPDVDRGFGIIVFEFKQKLAGLRCASRALKRYFEPGVREVSSHVKTDLI
jgi:hypothetical protein